jgi:disease resistance protein RPS2
MDTLPNWFISVVIEKAKTLEYIGYSDFINLLVEYDRGKLYSLKYLAVIECHVHRVLMNSGKRVQNTPVFESLEELYLEGVYGLEELCVGELPLGSLRNVKLLNVRNCLELVNALLPSNLLQRLQNLEILHCEYTEDARTTKMLEYVFEFERMEPEQMVLTKLREIILCYILNLISIWNGPAPYEVFRNLNSLALRGCHKLQKVFTAKAAECLGQLKLL